MGLLAIHHEIPQLNPTVKISFLSHGMKKEPRSFSANGNMGENT
jgi:hypothetical protein